MDNHVFMGLCQKTKVIPVVGVVKLTDAIPMARALVAGGMPVIEVTLRTDCAIKAMELINNEVPDAVVGAGTVLNKRQMESAMDAGAGFAVSPGTVPDLLSFARNIGMDYLPGVSNASDIMIAIEEGYNFLKFFSAESSGGVKRIKDFSGPFDGIKFCPTGGINLKNIAEYLSLANVVCCGGSWLVTADDKKNGNWDNVREKAKAATRLTRYLEKKINGQISNE